MAADLGLQTFELVKALAKKEYQKAGLNFAFVAIDTLVLTGLILGSWPLMVSAAAVSAFAMLILARACLEKITHLSYDDQAKYGFDMICTSANGMLAVFSSLCVSGVTGLREETSSHFEKGSYVSEKVTILNSMPASDFPILPLGGTQLASMTLIEDHDETITGKGIQIQIAKQDKREEKREERRRLAEEKGKKLYKAQLTTAMQESKKHLPPDLTHLVIDYL